MEAEGEPFVPRPAAGMGEGELQLLPFHISREQAAEQLEMMAEAAHITESAKGRTFLEGLQACFVTFHLVRGTASGQITYVRNRRATKNLPGQMRRYGFASLEFVPAAAVSAMPEMAAECIEPFYWEEMIRLPGNAWQDGKLESCIPADVVPEDVDWLAADDEAGEDHRSRKKLERMAEAAFKEDTLQPEGLSTASSGLRITVDRVEDVFCPLWVCRMRRRGHLYWFVMNGQTGRAVLYQPMKVHQRNATLTLWGALTVGLATVLAAVFCILAALGLRMPWALLMEVPALLVWMSVIAGWRRSVRETLRSWQEGPEPDPSWYVADSRIEDIKG